MAQCLALAVTLALAAALVVSTNHHPRQIRALGHAVQICCLRVCAHLEVGLQTPLAPLKLQTSQGSIVCSSGECGINVLDARAQDRGSLQLAMTVHLS